VGEWQGNAELTIPLEANDKQLGMAMLSKRRNGAEYTAKDRATLLSIAQIVAQAIEQDAEHKA
jgi:GAF domain-containing protein